MKIKKILSAAAAAVTVISVMAISANAFTATLSDSGFNGWGLTASSDTKADVTGDGTYTVSIEYPEAITVTDFFGLITDEAAEGVDVDGYSAAYPDMVITVDSIKADGVEQEKSPDAEGMKAESGVLRVNLWNSYLGTELYKNWLASDSLVGAKNLEVTFTVTGMGGAADAPASDSTTETAATGNAAAIAIVSVMAIAGMAAVASRKRK